MTASLASLSFDGAGGTAPVSVPLLRHSVTTLAMIGTAQAQDALLEIYDDEVDTRFCAPMLQPIALGLDSAHMKAFQKVTKKISKLTQHFGLLILPTILSTTTALTTNTIALRPASSM